MSADEQKWRQFLGQLQQSGFYRYTLPELVESLKRDAMQGGYLYGVFANPPVEPEALTTGRAFMTDAEDLAEGGVSELVRDMSPFLATQGARIMSISQDFEIGGGYSVRVNGTEYVMYSPVELVTEEIWGLTTQRAFAMLNGLLRGARSGEQVYLLYGGNDAQAVFLTPELHHLIEESPLIPDEEKPVSIDS